jgi:ribonuclease P protein component
MTTSFRLTPSMHLRRPQDFEMAYKTGERAGDAHLLVFAFTNGLSQTRVGLSVSKKHGSAVRRNLKRRRLKEAFRLLNHELPQGLDLILIPRQRDDSTLRDFQTSLKALAVRLARKLAREARPPLDEGGA